MRRAFPAAGGPAGWVDGTLIGGVEVLRDIPIGDVASIRYLASREATAQYGPGFPNGVLVLITGR